MCEEDYETVDYILRSCSLYETDRMQHCLSKSYFNTVWFKKVDWDKYKIYYHSLFIFLKSVLHFTIFFFLKFNIFKINSSLLLIYCLVIIFVLKQCYFVQFFQISKTYGSLKLRNRSIFIINILQTSLQVYNRL
jgi:hypothetical protein